MASLPFLYQFDNWIAYCLLNKLIPVTSLNQENLYPCSSSDCLQQFLLLALRIIKENSEPELIPKRSLFPTYRKTNIQKEN